ncbi:hypothetical protein N7470_008590 [Penicillium chermesinum]|nr:hypothetical protein N7470_008590 [Penicillium chermesinum]
MRKKRDISPIFAVKKVEQREIHQLGDGLRRRKWSTRAVFRVIRADRYLISITPSPDALRLLGGRILTRLWDDRFVKA